MVDHLDAHIASIDFDAPGRITDPDDPRMFGLYPLPGADPFDGPGPDTWARRLVFWEVAARPNPETIVATLDDDLRHALGAYTAGEVTTQVYADSASRDAALAELLEFYR